MKRMRKLWTVTTGLAGVLTLAACSSSTSGPADEPSGTIRGQVTVDEAPLPGATARLAGPISDLVTTDEAGAYVFGDVPIGSYTVEIEPPDPSTVFASRTLIVSIAAGGQEVTADFAGVFAPGAVYGTITAEGATMGGVSVGLIGPGAPRSTISSPHGEFRFDHVPFGMYLVTMSPPPGTRWPSVAEQVTIDQSTLVVEVAFTGQFYR